MSAIQPEGSTALIPKPDTRFHPPQQLTDSLFKVRITRNILLLQNQKFR
jgi:hypothetical protein